jgi:hypothetical protein
MSRVKAERAAAMLAERHAADIDPDPVVTAEEWLAAHRASDTVEDRHRTITDADLTSMTTDTDTGMAACTAVGADQHPADDGDRAAERDDARPDPLPIDRALHTHLRDIREVAADEPAQVAEDVVRVPPAAETAAGVTQAHRSIAEIRARTAEDDRIAEQTRTAELGRWHDHDHAAEIARTDTDKLDDHDPLDDADGFDRQPADY